MRTTGEIMSHIESRCAWVRQDSKMITDGVLALRHRRDFPTLVEDGFDLAEAELIAALQTVRKARATYNSLPAERDPYIVGAEHAA